MIRIALVNQPWSVSPPDHSADSIALVNYQLAIRLAKIANVRSYGRLLPGRPASEIIEGVEFRRVSARFDKLLKGLRLLDKWKLMPRRKPFHQSPLYHIAYSLAVARDLRKSPCDVVHVHNFAQCARIIRLLNPSIRIVLHMHCDWITQLDPQLVARSLKHVDLMLGVSGFITRKAQDRFSSMGVTFRTLYNGVDFERFAKAKSDGATGRRILYVGRLSPEKGVHVLLEAFAQIAGQFPDVSLDLIGPENVLSREFVDPGREDPQLERLSIYFETKGAYAKLLRELIPPAVASRIRFLGSLPHEELPCHYASAAMLVVPSVFDEPFGLPLAEGMAGGIPCIATRAGAFPEIIEDGTTGILVHRGEVNELAAAISELLADPPKSQRMGYRGRERADQLFSWDRNARILADYLGVVPCVESQVAMSVIGGK